MKKADAEKQGEESLLTHAPSAVEKSKRHPAPHYTGHRARLRERVLKAGGGSLADYEVLEMLLFGSNPRSDVKPLAKSLLARFGSLNKVLNAPNERLKEIENCTPAVIATLKNAEELVSRLLQETVQKKTVLQSWKALLDYCRVTMSNNQTEQFRIFFLDSKNQLIADEKQQEGTINHTPVYPREVVKRALELGAASLILAHNHPSGDPAPSKADISMTKQIMQAAAAVNIDVHDHLIIGGNDHYSFAAHGLM